MYKEAKENTISCIHSKVNMLCPFCKSDDLKVTDKRASGISGIRRRRECLKCGKRFTTYERPEIEINVVKKDGRREAFSRDKLKSGFMKACEKRPISIEEIDKVLDDIEESLMKKGKEINSKIIGELVMRKLKKLDKVAYIRFASVYRDFKDINDFKKEIREVGK